MAAYTTIASGAATSAVVALSDARQSLAIEVPSHSTAWGDVRVEFATTSAGPFRPFLPMNAASSYVWRGAGPGFGEVQRPPAGFARVSVTNSTASVASFGLYSVRH